MLSKRPDYQKIHVMSNDPQPKSKKLQLILLAVLMVIIILGIVKWPGTEYLDLTEYLPRYSLSSYPPKTLMYSAMTLEYLKTTAPFWKEKTGINGFIFTTLPTNWFNEPRELASYRELATEVNALCRKNDIDANFVKLALGHRTLPDYFNDAAWDKLLAEVQAVAAFAKETGFIGVALDTESYSKLLFDSSKAPLAKYPKDQLKKKIYQRGREIMQTITMVFPDAEVFIFPEGYLLSYPQEGPAKYELWMDLFNGLLSVQNRKGVVLGCEALYKITRKNKLLDFYYREIPLLVDKLDNPTFWLEKCSVALGAWPLGREYWNKSAWYGPAEFNRQFRTMEMLCPRYVWIYAHGSAWWQEKDNAKYTLHQEARLPTVRNIADYYAVVKKSRDIGLKDYYYALKYKSWPSLLEIILKKLVSSSTDRTL
jgi:hypothetical protein